MGFLSWIRWRGGKPPEVKRNAKGQASVEDCAQGFLVLHLPENTPGFPEELLQEIEALVTAQTRRCAWPLKFRVVQSAMDGKNGAA